MRIGAVSFQKCHSRAVLPKPAFLGFTVHAVEAIVIPDASSRWVPLGLKSAFPPTMVAMFCLGGTGVVAADDRTEWRVLVNGPREFEPGWAVAHVIFLPCFVPELAWTDDLPPSSSANRASDVSGPNIPPTG